MGSRVDFSATGTRWAQLGENILGGAWIIKKLIIFRAFGFMGFSSFNRTMLELKQLVYRFYAGKASHF